MLAAARGRRRPVRWFLPALGIALAAAFAVGVAAQSQIAADQSARSVLDKASPLDREVRVTWQGPVSPDVADQARALIHGLGLGVPTAVVLLNPVRLGGVVVRPAAIAPPGPVAFRPSTGPAGILGSLPPGTLPDVAGRRRPGPFEPGCDRRPHPGRRLVVAALGGPPAAALATPAVSSRRNGQHGAGAGCYRPA